MSSLVLVLVKHTFMGEAGSEQANRQMNKITQAARLWGCGPQAGHTPRAPDLHGSSRSLRKV